MRTGSVSGELEVLYRWQPGNGRTKNSERLKISPGMASQRFGLKNLLSGLWPPRNGGVLSIVPSDNDYVSGRSGSVTVKPVRRSFAGFLAHFFRR